MVLAVAYLDPRTIGLWYTGRSGIGPAKVRRQWYSSVYVEWRVAPWVFDLLPSRFCFNPPSCIEVHYVDYCANLLSGSGGAVGGSFDAAHVDAVAE